jgi:hypothetical protein
VSEIIIDLPGANDDQAIEVARKLNAGDSSLISLAGRAAGGEMALSATVGAEAEDEQVQQVIDEAAQQAGVEDFSAHRVETASS